KSAFVAAGDAAIDLWNNYITPAWEGIKAAFQAAWEFIKPIFDRVKSGFENLKTGVVAVANAIRDGVKSAFSGLADIIKAPLRVLGTFLSGLPTKVGPFEIPFAGALRDWGSKLQGLRAGGRVSGPGGPRD